MNDKTAIEYLKTIAKRDDWTSGEIRHFAKTALAALDAEKPGDDARDVAQNIIGMALSDYSGLDRLLENDTCIAIEMIQTYAASYHADKCKVCNDFCSRAKEHCEDRESPIV
jgi:hypothetical protein